MKINRNLLVLLLAVFTSAFVSAQGLLNEYRKLQFELLFKRAVLGAISHGEEINDTLGVSDSEHPKVLAVPLAVGAWKLTSMGKSFSDKTSRTLFPNKKLRIDQKLQDLAEKQPPLLKRQAELKAVIEEIENKNPQTKGLVEQLRAMKDYNPSQDLKNPSMFERGAAATRQLGDAAVQKTQEGAKAITEKTQEGAKAIVEKTHNAGQAVESMGRRFRKKAWDARQGSPPAPAGPEAAPPEAADSSKANPNSANSPPNDSPKTNGAQILKQKKDLISELRKNEAGRTWITNSKDLAAVHSQLKDISEEIISRNADRVKLISSKSYKALSFLRGAGLTAAFVGAMVSYVVIAGDTLLIYFEDHEVLEKLKDQYARDVWDLSEVLGDDRWFY